MIETLELELSLEHIHPELIDINCDVQVEYYRGSNETDDPSSLDVISIITNDLIGCLVNGSIVDCKSYDIKIDDNLYAQILKKYEQFQD